MPHTENQKLIDALNACALDCEHCASQCLDEDDVDMLTRCIRLNIDCAAMCRFLTGMMARGSEYAKRLLPQCAALCEDCAIECNAHSHMRHCERCAQVCRDCAAACISAGQSLAA